MITRIELDGFKTFQNFKLELGPFQVIVGPNGAGKSNLFDALRLLSILSHSDISIREAFQSLRGETGELFMMQLDGNSTDNMSLSLEMLVGQKVQDSWGAQANLDYTRLRYELTIARRVNAQGLERFYVTHERLEPIEQRDDEWSKSYLGKAKNIWQKQLKTRRSEPFISTGIDAGKTTICLHQDGHGGHKSSVAEKMERTILSGITNAEFPHSFAVREEMRNWKFLHLNPEVLRSPCSMLAPPFVQPDGRNLASAIARMEAEDPAALNDISRDLANLIPGLLKIEVEKDVPLNRYGIYARTQDGRRFSSRVLSDGTLRLLVLAALKNDIRHQGVLCFEEPENGVHPFRLKNMVHLLRDLATDFIDPEEEQPLRQLLVNTHSPVLVSQMVEQHDQQYTTKGLLFAHMITRMFTDKPGPLRITRIVPVQPSRHLKKSLNINDQEQSYTFEQVMKYLNSADIGEGLKILRGENI
jgi:predicted ATPase